MIFQKHNILNKILLSTILLVLIASITAFIGLGLIEKQARLNLGNSLNIVLQTTTEYHATWIENQKSILGFIAKEPVVISAVKELVSKSNAKKNLLNNQHLNKLREYFSTIKTGIKDIGFFVISTDYINLASMRDQNIGIENVIFQVRPDLIKKAFNGETVFVPPIKSDVALQGKSLRNSPTMFFVTPVKDKDRILALLSVRIYPEHDFTRITQIGRIGETGETYAFDQSGLMISNSRFNHHLHKAGLLVEDDDESILNIQIRDPGGNIMDGFKSDTKLSDLPLTLMAKSAISGLSEINVKGYRDYRGVRVLGAWLWNPGLGYGLTTEIDEQEALQGYRATKNTIIIIISISLLLSILLVSVVYWFEQRAHLIIKQSHVMLEQQVEERTHELSSAYAELQKTLSDLKYLEGIIPICSYCKSIRNDEGSWDMLEKYLLHNTDAKFSHGICPNCLKKERLKAGLDKE